MTMHRFQSPQVQHRFTRDHRYRALFIAVACAVIAGCGGGGGSGTPQQPADPTNNGPQRSPSLLWREYLQLSREYRLVQPNSGGVFVLFKFDPPVLEAAPLSGVSASRSRRHHTAHINPVADPTPTYYGYLDLFTNPEGLVVGHSTTLGEAMTVYCFATESATALPTKATVGESGPIASFRQNVACDPTSSDATYRYELTWFLRDDGSIPGAVLFCVRRTEIGPVFTPSFEELCLDARADNTLGSIGRLTYNGVSFYRTE